jgi:hypothetical protein
MQIERKRLEQELKGVVAGLTPQETIEQSDCFVFQDGRVTTFNDEIACHSPCCLPVTGAIKAIKLMKMIEQWPEDNIEFELSKTKLKFQGKNRHGYFVMQKQITLPIKEIEAAEKWKSLPKDFLTALSLVEKCASHDETKTKLALICLHLSKEWVESCDGTQGGRYYMKLPFEKSVLLHRKVIRWLIGIHPNQVSETTHWVHFRDGKEKDRIISCRKRGDNYAPSEMLTNIYKTKGTPVKLPKDLKKLTDRLKVFLDNEDSIVKTALMVQLDGKRVQITSKGIYGSQTEKAKIQYAGKPFTFNIDPDLLKEFSIQYDECEVSDKNIKVRKGDYQFVSCLWLPE